MVFRSWLISGSQSTVSCHGYKHGAWHVRSDLEKGLGLGKGLENRIYRVRSPFYQFGDNALHRDCHWAYGNAADDLNEQSLYRPWKYGVLAGDVEIRHNTGKLNFRT